MWIFSVRLCRCRVLEETVTAGMVSCMFLCWGVDFAGLVILASSPYSSELLVPGGGLGIYIRLFRKEVVET